MLEEALVEMVWSRQEDYNARTPCGSVYLSTGGSDNVSVGAVGGSGAGWVRRCGAAHMIGSRTWVTERWWDDFAPERV